jgi:hypothetical protein
MQVGRLGYHLVRTVCAQVKHRWRSAHNDSGHFVEIEARINIAGRCSRQKNIEGRKIRPSMGYRSTSMPGR